MDFVYDHAAWFFGAWLLAIGLLILLRERD